MKSKIIKVRYFLVLHVLCFLTNITALASVVPYDFETDGIFYSVNSDGSTVNVSYKDEGFNTYSGDVTIPYNVICPYKRMPQFSSSDYFDWAYSNPAIELNSDNILNNKILLCTTIDGQNLTLTSPKYDYSAGQIIKMHVEWCTENWQSSSFVVNKVALTAAILDDNGQSVDSVTMHFNEISRINDVYLSITVPRDIASARLRFAAWNADSNSYGAIRSIEISPMIENKSYDVTGIGAYAFKGCSDLNSVTLPNSIITIGEQAFRNCKALTSMSIPDSVTSIGKESFLNCDNLKSVTLGKSITTIGENAFMGTVGLEDLYWNPISCNTNGNMSTTNLIHVIIGSEVIVLPDNFVTNSRVMEVLLPNTIVFIGNNAFNGCAQLKSVTIPSSLISIGNDAFYDCVGLTNLIWNANNCTSNGNMTTSNIEKATIGQSVTVLPDHFVSGSKVSEVLIPNSVTTIGSSAFENCTLLSIVCIPKSINTIKPRAFHGCSNLYSVIMLNSTPPLGSDSMFPANQVIYVPNVQSYKSSTYWKSYNIQGFYTITPQITRASVSSNLKDIIILDKAFLKDTLGQVINVYNALDDFLNISDLVPETNYNVEISITISQEAIINVDDSFTTGLIAFKDFRSLSTNLTSALISYKVNRDEGFVIDSCGVDINTVIGTESYLGYIKESSDGTYTIECEITGLMPNNNYNLRPWVVHKGVKYDGAYSSIRTASVSFNQFDISSRTQTTLTLSFCVDRDDSFIIESCGIENGSEIYDGVIIETSNENYKIQCILSDLTPNNSYLLRPWIQFKNKKYYGNDKTFQTSPVEVYHDATVTPTSVYLTASYVSGDANITDSYFTFNGEKIKSLYQTGLNPSTTYSYSYTIETTSGNQVNYYSFYTPALSMVAQPVKMLTNTMVMFEAVTNMIDGETMVGFEWRRYDAPIEMPSTQVYSPVFGGKIAGTLKNLAENVYYKYRPFYKSNSGKFYYGDWVAFLTADAGVEYEPIVYTYNSPAITQTEATLQGVALRGSDDITEQGFEYWKSGNSTVTTVIATGERMSKKVTGLQSGTKYTFRAFLLAGGETHYGNEVEFVTLSNSLDVNLDGEINIADINMIIDIILTGKPGVTCDTNGDGEVNIADINTVIDAILSH